MQLTLWLDLSTSRGVSVDGVTGYTTVTCVEVAPADLGALYFDAYSPPDRPPTLDDANAEMAQTLGGAYGPLIPEASLALMSEDRPVAVVQTVLRAPWTDVQDGPFVIELFTAPDHRNRGLGRTLMQRAIAATAALGEQWLGLRVDSENAAALRVYRSLGFTERDGG